MADDSGNGKKALAKAFAIHPDNTVAPYAAGEAPEGSVLFATEAELTAISASWPAKTLLAIWNGLPGVTAVTKFTDRKTAVRRIWQVIAGIPPGVGQPARGGKAGKQRKATAKQTGFQSKAGTKTERVIALLKHPEGATLKAIMAATGWQAHSVRGFISAQLTKRMRLKVRSFKRDGERVYRIR